MSPLARRGNGRAREVTFGDRRLDATTGGGWRGTRKMNAHAAAECRSTASPSARLEGGVVAVVEADPAREEPVLVELGITGTGGGIHLVGALPGEADAGRAVAAVQAALDRAEDGNRRRGITADEA